MTRILSIDPSSNKIETSTTGIVLLDNAKLENSWVASYGVQGFKEWFETVGYNLKAASNGFCITVPIAA